MDNCACGAAGNTGVPAPVPATAPSCPQGRAETKVARAPVPPQHTPLGGIKQPPSCPVLPLTAPLCRVLEPSRQAMEPAMEPGAGAGAGAGTGALHVVNPLFLAEHGGPRATRGWRRTTLRRTLHPAQAPQQALEPGRGKPGAGGATGSNRDVA